MYKFKYLQGYFPALVGAVVTPKTPKSLTNSVPAGGIGAFELKRLFSAVPAPIKPNMETTQ